MSFKKLSNLLDKRKKITNNIIDMANHAFPVGSIVRFKKGRGVVQAEIIRGLEYNEHFFIRSSTGKEYWIDLYYLMRGTAPNTPK